VLRSIGYGNPDWFPRVRWSVLMQDSSIVTAKDDKVYVGIDQNEMLKMQ
jgi:hypothetical protein